MTPPEAPSAPPPRGQRIGPAEPDPSARLGQGVKRGVLLFAHGARDPHWALPFAEVARRVEAQGVETRLAFLEFMSPDLLEAGRQLAETGCTRVDIVPLFLGAGGHVRKDLPLLVGQLRAAHEAVDWTLRPAVGESERVIDAMATEALAAMK